MASSNDDIGDPFLPHELLPPTPLLEHLSPCVVVRFDGRSPHWPWSGSSNEPVVKRGQPADFPCISGGHAAVSPQAQFLVDWSFTSTYGEWVVPGIIVLRIFIFVAVGIPNNSSEVDGGDVLQSNLFSRSKIPLNSCIYLARMVTTALGGLQASVFVSPCNKGPSASYKRLLQARPK